MTDVVLALGRPDRPTDGVHDYAERLAHALSHRGVETQVTRLPHGRPAERAARSLARAHPGAWIVLQYTALSWSPRALPANFPRLVRAIQQEGMGTRCALVLHDIVPYGGSGLKQRVQRAVQTRAMRRSVALAEKILSPVPPESLGWVPQSDAVRFTTVPIGANVTAITKERSRPPWTANAVKTVGVFGITGDARGSEEVQRVVATVTHLRRKGLAVRVLGFGRGVESRADDLRRALKPTGATLVTRGVLTPDEVSEAIASCDIMLFVRGPLTAQRGSAIAAIAAGTPMIAHAGCGTAPPITDAGVLLAPDGDHEQLAALAAEALLDEKVWKQLHDAQRRAFATHFSWDAVAARFAEALRG